MTKYKSLVAVALISLPLLLNGCKGCESIVSHTKSKLVGLNRRVTLYSMNGKVIKAWEGNFMVEDKGGTCRFIHNGKAVTISGTFLIEEI